MLIYTNIKSKASITIYGLLIWGSTCKSYLDKLIKLQKWAIRTITNSQYRSHTGPLFAKSNLLNVTDMYTLELGVFMYKYSINDLPVAFKEYFMKRSDIHDYPTRYVNNLNLTNNRKSFSDHAIRTNGPILWNSLSKTIRESKSVKHFRNQFKQNLIKTYEKFWIFEHVLSCPKSCLVFRCQIVSFPFYVFWFGIFLCD